MNNDETYPKDFATVTLKVSPDGQTIYAVGGDREPGEGDTAYIGFERLKERFINDTIPENISSAIKLERDYQDSAHGDIDVHGHTVAEWLMIMEKKINDAKTGWYKEGDNQALLEILKVISSGVACLEQHRIVRTR